MLDILNKNIKELALKNQKLIFLATLFFMIGVAGIIMVFMRGQEASYNVSRQVPWGLLLIGYAYFVGLSVGIASLLAIQHIFKVHFYAKMTKHLQLLALASLIAAFWLIFWELGGPFELQILRFIRYYANFQLNSPIWWMSTFYVIEAPLLVIELFFMIKGDEKSSFYAAWVGLIMGIVAFSTLSMVFAVNAAHPLYNSAAFSVSFIMGAMICGCAFVLIFNFILKPQDFTKLLKPLAITLFLFLLAMLFLDLWSLLIASYSKDTPQALSFALLTSGPLSFNFYFFELFIGLVLPIILLIKASFYDIKILAFASVLALVGAFFARYDLIIAGELIRVESPYLEKLEYSSYFPSLAELAIFCSAFGVILFVYALGRIFLKLEGE